MKKLTDEEAAVIPSKQIGKKSLARIYLMNLEVGDIIRLDKSEWKQKKNPPSELIRRMRKTENRDFTCETILDGTGWIIKRIK
jgi:hypothetical protein